MKLFKRKFASKFLNAHQSCNRSTNISAKAQLIKPLNGDPFIGMVETPVTTAPIVVNYLSNLPAYRTGVSPLLRGVEIGLAHGFFLPGPFIKLGPLRAVEGTAEIAGCMAAAGLVLILAVCLSIYGAASFQRKEIVGIKTLSGREITPDEWQTSSGWGEFTSGWVVGGQWCYLLLFIYSVVSLL